MPTAPQNEIGVQGGYRPSFLPTTGAPIFMVDPNESTPELMWPFSTMVYDSMRRTDGQVSGILKACTLPIRSARWTLDTDGVDPDVVALVRTELGLEEPGQTRRRRRREGIVWKEHLRDALLAVPYGHMPFEQVYEVGAARDDQADVGLEEIVHLRKLSPRMPRTLTEIRVSRDGGLAGISQPPLEVMGGRYIERFIPVDRLVMYCMDREGADWTGTSILRPAYKHWLTKDALIRTAAQIVERNGMGVPVAEYDDNVDGAKRSDAEYAVQQFRSGATAGMVLPVGMNFKLVGVTGSTVDPLPQIEYHDQAIAKNALAMFLDLGHDAGARSLGETFVDFFTASLQAVADAIAETATEHIIRDLVEWNWPGQDRAYPILNPGILAENQEVTSTTLANLANAGLITPDGKLENALRKRSGLPDVDEATRTVATARAMQAAPDTAPGATVTMDGLLPLSEGLDLTERAIMLTERIAALRAQHNGG